MKQAVEELTNYLRTNIFEQGDFGRVAISDEGWNYVWKKPKELIKEKNEKRLEDEKREKEIREKLREKADKLFEFYDQAVSRLRPHLTTELDDEVFGKWRDKVETFRENAVQHLADVLRYLSDEVALESSEFKNFIENYIKNVQIGHNRTEKFGLENHF
jgi:hypothetical protein